MKRYYSRLTRGEVFEPSKDTLALGDGQIDWWFKELPKGKVVEYLKDGTPSLIDEPIVIIDTLAVEKTRLTEELNAIVGNLSPAESMYLMLQYGFAKMNPNDSEDEATISLTPTGEDIVTWGDRIAQELGNKLVEIKNLK